MARRLKPGIREHDFLYLSFLVIASSGLFTLLLFGLYCWYDTGRFPLPYGISASATSGDSIRFWVSSIYVPFFLAFAGIAIAHRLMSRGDGERLSPALSDDRLSRMAAESDSRTLESILDILSGSDLAGTGYWEHGPAGWDADRRPRNSTDSYAMPYVSADAGHAVVDSPLAIDVVANAHSQEKSFGQVSQPPAGAEATVAPAAPAAAAGPETAQAEKKEVDFLEQLKDPVNREKLAALLAGIE